VRLAPELQARRVLEDRLAHLWWASREVTRQRATALRGDLDRTLEAMFAFDLLGPADMAAWRERADRLMRAGFPVGDERTVARARADLAALAGAEETAQAASVAYRSLGIVTLDELDSIARPEEADSETERRTAAPLAELRRIVLVSASAGRNLDLLSIELYADAAVLRWHAILAADQWPTGAPGGVADPWTVRQRALYGPRGIRLSDSHGTDYQHFNLGGQLRPAPEDQVVIHWSDGFTPAVPATASELIVSCRGSELRVDVH
jgi:hypothetical protein